MDLQQLYDTLAKVSDGRVLGAGDHRVEGDFNILRIPVRQINPGDKTDQALRRYCADWVRKNTKDVSVDAKWEALKGISWFDDKNRGVGIPLAGAIVISWWPRPPMSSLDELLALQRARKDAANAE